ncbi:Uncharacterised protein [Yersinia frederiksenii]|uniref:hypothetical protein n=1 Tax=Yersinia frederiksenii TaxID=29484 RepID=UPI0005E2516F|nr:hypothetical protein [Yersinia frederiksenii]CND06639.1 Uncharacterised protein [Yersinia frederiksenii]
MKELDQFTVERLTQLSKTKIIYGGDISEIRALARIALSAKQAEPEWYVVITSMGVWQSRYKTRKEAENHIKPWHKDYWIKELYATPPANSLVVPEGWKLVPVIPSRQMMAQGHFAMGGTDRGKFMRIYQAMLAAAPTSLLEGE